MKKIVLAIAILATFQASQACELEGKSPEYLLAFIDNGGCIADDDILVARFRSLLDMLSVAFPDQTRESIGDGIVTARKSMRERGISESLLKIAEGLNRAFIQNETGVRFKGAIVWYEYMRMRGLSHWEAVAQLLYPSTRRDLALKWK